MVMEKLKLKGRNVYIEKNTNTNQLSSSLFLTAKRYKITFVVIKYHPHFLQTCDIEEIGCV